MGWNIMVSVIESNGMPIEFQMEQGLALKDLVKKYFWYTGKPETPCYVEIAKMNCRELLDSDDTVEGAGVPNGSVLIQTPR